MDDHRDSADSLAAILGLFGYRVETAYDEAGASRMAAESLPDVAVLDLGMSGIDALNWPAGSGRARGVRGSSSSP